MKVNYETIQQRFCSGATFDNTLPSNRGGNVGESRQHIQVLSCDFVKYCFGRARNPLMYFYGGLRQITEYSVMFKSKSFFPKMHLFIVLEKQGEHCICSIHGDSCPLVGDGKCVPQFACSLIL